jgi:hypothetical protein
MGRAISKSDVADLADSAIERGDVLFVPVAQAAGLADRAGVGATGDLTYAFFDLDARQLAGLDGASTAIDEQGNFAVPVSAGNYMICLANIFADQTAGPPYSVVGCASADLSADGVLTVSHGEGGVEATLD